VQDLLESDFIHYTYKDAEPEFVNSWTLRIEISRLLEENISKISEAQYGFSVRRIACIKLDILTSHKIAYNLSIVIYISLQQ